MNRLPFSPALLILGLGFCSYFPDKVDANAAGAPTSPETCMNMTPQHGMDPQTTPFPYTIYLSKSELMPGDTVKIQVCSSKDKLKGFFIQARKENFEKETMPMGTFMIEENFEGGKLVKCGMDNDTITHTNNMDKDHVNAIWMAPKETGIYHIVVTVAKNGGVFWVKQPSMKITVK